MPEAITTLAGFEEPVQQAQAVFRALLDAMAQPARVVDLPTGNELPDGIEPASARSCGRGGAPARVCSSPERKVQSVSFSARWIMMAPPHHTHRPTRPASVSGGPPLERARA